MRRGNWAVGWRQMLVIGALMAALLGLSGCGEGNGKDKGDSGLRGGHTHVTYAVPGRAMQKAGRG